MNILVTGCAGFIGFHVSKKLLKKNISVYGIDNINSYYSLKIKYSRLQILKKNKNFKFEKLDITNLKNLKNFFYKNKIEYVIHLAAQAGVRYSIKNPSTYTKNNLLGFFNVLDCSRIYKIKHFIFASTSSVYGASTRFPLKEENDTDKPLSFYAATKKSNEIMAYSYSNIYKFSCTGLRFFTVYGPYGRPDMSLFKFVKNIINNKSIDLYNFGDHIRDFTYIDDIVIRIEKLILKPPSKNIPYQIFNIGGSNPKTLKYFVKIIEKHLQKKAKINLMKMQPGDVHKTHSSINKIDKYIGKFKPTPLDKGIVLFIKWYKANIKMLK